MTIRWLSRTRQSMQRIGFIKALLSLLNSRGLMGNYFETLETQLNTNKFQIPYEENIAKWLKETGEKNLINDLLSINIQKYYIYHHPSQTGWLSKLGLKEYFEYFPYSLGIINNNRLTEMGLLFDKCIFAESQIDAFENISDDNPLILHLEEQIYFLYILLCTDGDFLIPFIGSLLNTYQNNDFNYLEAGEVLPDLISGINQLFSGTTYTSSDREQLLKLRSFREKIVKEIVLKIEKQGSGSRREQTTIPRIEWLVDLGLLRRVKSRQWCFTNVGKKTIIFYKKYQELSKTKYPENIIQSLIDDYFYLIIYKIYLDIEPKIIAKDDFLDFIFPAYKKLLGIGGYTLLRPLLLCANIMAIEKSTGYYIEYSQAKRYLEELFIDKPDIIHFTINRFNTDLQLKLNQ